MATRFETIKNNMLKSANDQKEKTRREYKDFFDHPLLYAAIIASGFLSSLAGVAIGLGVRMVGGELQSTLDVPHIFFAVLYAFAFPYFFEFGLANWLHKLLHRESGNNYQLFTAWAMIVVTFIGTAITAYSAMDVLVTAGGFFESFKSIPPSVQKWIAYSLPTMILLNIASGETYRQFTTEAILQRAADMELRETQVAADMEVKLAQVTAKKDVAIAASNEYSRQAANEAPELGRQKGASTWKNDSAGYKVQPAMTTKDADTELIELREEVSRLRQQSPKAPADK